MFVHTYIYMCYYVYIYIYMRKYIYIYIRVSSHGGNPHIEISPPGVPPWKIAQRRFFSSFCSSSCLFRRPSARSSLAALTSSTWWERWRGYNVRVDHWDILRILRICLGHIASLIYLLFNVLICLHERIWKYVDIRPEAYTYTYIIRVHAYIVIVQCSYIAQYTRQSTVHLFTLERSRSVGA